LEETVDLWLFEHFDRRLLIITLFNLTPHQPSMNSAIRPPSVHTASSSLLFLTSSLWQRHLFFLLGCYKQTETDDVSSVR
jgi:hypothetical protein